MAARRRRLRERRVTKAERTKKAEPPISSFVDVGSENVDFVDGEAVDVEVED